MGFPGGYWPLLEMQARAIVRDWTDPLPVTTLSQQAQHTELIKYYQDLRTAVKECRKAEIPRNPFGDNVGLLEQASRELELERFDLEFSETEGFVCSARYTEPGSDKTEPMKTLMALQAVQQKSRGGGYLARAVFHGFLGE
ncbi:hypothetical protein BU23DRAFT_556555 [Bimuria novae-zelandiae CBS 107.79]|uniref:Uncharacterized protein n=1 Tax=Bimuria novae-zelandiae CBS 107.79 TaxID=1447943 RepID=A0A6A5V782_9PLEO|nr:hypothetical protein BU23DRAFT_556555 [Bimuria novae-zelandiae CBS 107.79]